MPFIWTTFDGFGRGPVPVRWDGIAKWLKENVPFEETAERDEEVMVLLYRTDSLDEGVAIGHMNSGLSGPRYIKFKAADNPTDEENREIAILGTLYID